MPSTGGTTRLSFLHRLRSRDDTQTWRIFHKQYGELLINYARRLGATLDTAEDIAQEVEMYVFRAMENFRHRARKGCFRAYLRSSVVHALARRIKQQARQEATLDPSSIARLANSDADQDAVWQREHYLHRIRFAIRAIAGEVEPSTLEAFRLHALAGCSGADTAARLGISVDCVYQAKSRVIKRLRELIRAMEAEDSS